MTDNAVRGATFVRTIDGDTFVAMLDLAPKVSPQPFLRTHIRVNGWNAAELNEVEGPYMREQFDLQLRAAKVISLRMLGMTFNRVACDVYLDGVVFAGILKAALQKFRLFQAAAQRQARGAQ